VDSGCSEALCKWLIQKGANNEAEDDQELTPLLRACDQGDRGGCIGALLQHGIDAHKYRYRHQFALESALAKDDWRVADNLIQHGITLDPNSSRLRRISIRFCARLNYSFLLELLIRADNVDIEKRDFRGHTALGAAVDADRLESVQVLLRHGANANADGPCQCGNPSHKATLLRLAAGQGSAEILRALLDAGADPNVRNDNNNTALTFAAEFGHNECVEILLGVDGIDVNAVDDDGDSALLCAVHGGKRGATRILLANKDVDRTLRNKLGFTAEELAGEGGRVGFKELFEEGKAKGEEEKVNGLAIRVNGTKEGSEEEGIEER
jgi:uncharacterized protein